MRTKEWVTFRGKTIRITPDFSTQVMKVRRDWYNILQTLKENNFQPSLLYPAKISFKIDEEIKTFQDKQKLKEFMTTKLALEKIHKEIKHKKEKEINTRTRGGANFTKWTTK